LTSPSRSPKLAGTLAIASPDGGVPQRKLVRIFPEPAANLSVDEVYADLNLPAGRLSRPYTVINAIGTLDGRGAVGGKSTPIGSEVDHCLMRNIRASVDAVLVGAGTLRSEDLTLSVDESLARRRRDHGLEEQPLSIILTESGNIPTDRKIFRTSGKSDIVILAGSQTSQQRLATLSEMATVRTITATYTPEPEEILETLAEEFGVRRLLLEGGPSVNHSFLEARLVDELFLTLAPKILGGGPNSLVEGEPLPQLVTAPSLVSVYLYDSEVFLRYQLWPAP
jgi:2,5-diamino-6-(ribosylamino)-4(3H)-pyrimidinone 5'-phosphate reductase